MKHNLLPMALRLIAITYVLLVIWGAIVALAAPGLLAWKLQEAARLVCPRR